MIHEKTTTSETDDTKSHDEMEPDKSETSNAVLPEQSNSGQTSPIPADDRIVRHIMVIGFHHKHGYQVDYCYPPLTSDGPVFSTPACPITLPACWKTLPLLCLPDGSHNYDSDTIYFTMPDDTHPVNNGKDARQEENGESSSKRSLETGIRTIFGTACYRQIQSDKLLNRTDDMTRFAVQKSVCILSTKPLFGVIRSKLEMITHAYFEELDFSKVRILKMTYDNLNSLLSRESVVENAAFLGLSARQLVSQFGCNTLLLFKAILLERKILFYKSPVRDLCSTIMSMCSIFTGLLENGGLDYSTCDLQLSPHLLEALKLSAPKEESQKEAFQEPRRDDKVYFSHTKEEVVIVCDNTTGSDIQNGVQLGGSINSNPHEETGPSETSSSKNATCPNDNSDFAIISSDELVESDQDSTFNDDSCVEDPYASRLCRMKLDDCGLPLQIFTKGSFCLPYLSISYLDLLADARVKSYVIGATNFLFKQRKELYDVIVDMEENSICINDPNLKRSLSLTTEDLRFMDYISRHVKVENNQPRDEFDLSSHDITNWVGGDEWIRFQFRLYTMYLLKASRGSQPSIESFNSQFVRAWRHTTNNYKIWEASGKAAVIDKLQARHPFSSSSKGINFSDMKLKFSYAVQSSERGRMLNQTLNEIGKWSIWNNIASAAAAASASASNSISATLTSQVNSPKQSGNDVTEKERDSNLDGSSKDLNQ